MSIYSLMEQVWDLRFRHLLNIEKSIYIKIYMYVYPMIS